MAPKNPGKKKREEASKEAGKVSSSQEVKDKAMGDSPENESESVQDEQEVEGAEIDEREEKIDELEKELAHLNDKHIRLIAEYDNYRKRTLKEKIELSRLAGEKILTEILPVVDDFERALQHLDSASDAESVRAGIDLIYNKFMGYLSRQGVQEIETIEQEFDVDIHEAVTKVPAPKEEMKGKIVDCVQKGYKLEEKVIRYPKVVVGE